MYLSVVLSRLLLEEEISSSQRFQISRNAEGVGAMRLGQAKSNALVLRQIAVGVLDRQFRVRLAIVFGNTAAYRAGATCILRRHRMNVSAQSQRLP